MSDDDEDECLKYEDIHNMIMRIEKNFAKESVFIGCESPILLDELANRKAERRYQLTIDKMMSKEL